MRTFRGTFSAPTKLPQTLMFDLGKPWNVFRVMFTWQPRSVMFEVGWCVMLYTTVLFLEFLPVVFERFRLEPLRCRP